MNRRRFIGVVATVTPFVPSGATGLVIGGEERQGRRHADAGQPGSSTGIVAVGGDTLFLPGPADRPATGSLHYALGFPFQAGPRTMGLLAMRQIEQTPNYGFLDGSDVILLDGLGPPPRARIVKATRSEMEEFPEGEPRLLLRSPLVGGFVPHGAVHPHAGTGFGISQAHRFPFRDGRFSWGDAARHDLLEVYQLAFDGETFTSRRERSWPQNPRNADDALRIGASGWSILVTGLGNAIPDGDDLLMATLAARMDHGGLAAGTVRWSWREERWQPVEFEAVVTARQPVPEGPNPMERCPWYEPSLARGADDGILFAVRDKDSFGQPGDAASGYRLRVWRSAGRGMWDPVLDAPRMRLNSPVTVNVAVDGSAYLVSNPFDPAFVPETDDSGRGRERLVLWPLDVDRGRLGTAWTVRDCLDELGPPPAADQAEFWMADHAVGATVRLGDGRWHHLLCYRVCHSPRYRPSTTMPSPASGCYVEEVVSRGPARPVWRFAPLATLDVAELKSATLRFVESMRLDDVSYGRYRYAAGCSEPTLYSSTYAAMTRDLYDDLGTLSAADRADWIRHLQTHQDDDGLFRDPVIFDQGQYANDPEWCGRRHLSCHVVTALTSLGAVAAKPLRFLEPFFAPGGLVRWLESRDWHDHPDFVGNEVLNVGTLLQYARDFQKHPRAAAAVEAMLRWIDAHHMNAATGLWGGLDVSQPRLLSTAVQGAYHFWLLYFYDDEPLPHPERAVDSCLATQNACGGFGQGVHTGSVRVISACVDFDSFDPLARLLFREPPYRRDDIRRALARAAEIVLAAQADDGGFQFVRGRRFEYGHPQLAADATEGAMFPTWFRTLTLAYLGKALPDSPLGRVPWRFGNCPGIQFWRDAPPRQRGNDATGATRHGARP